jgi:hypothetical protein
MQHRLKMIRKQELISKSVIAGQNLVVYQTSVAEGQTMAAQRIRAISLQRLVRLASRAIVVASLFMLQALPLSFSPQHNSATQQEYSVASGYCSALWQAGAPGNHRHEHSEHCPLCGVNQARDGLRCLAVPPIAVPFPSSQCVILSQHGPREPSTSATGWTSAWSSRSPPTFS